MANTDISNEYLSMLKEFWLKEGVQNLIARNSRVLPKFEILRCVGKEQCIAVSAGFGGAISGDYTKALANVASQGEVSSFHYTPGRLFSLYKVSPAEYEVSKNHDGATMTIEGVKHAKTTDRTRKVLSGTGLYGKGYGELCVIGATDALSTSADTEYTVPFNVYMQISNGMRLAFKASVTGAEAATMTVVGKGQYNGGNSATIKVRGDAAYTPAATDILAIEGATVPLNGSYVPRFPVGLGALLDVTEKRTGANWTAHIGQTFFGVNRSSDVNAYCGSFIDDSASTNSKKTSLKKALRIADAMGSRADLIILNDTDWEELSDEIESQNLYYSNVKDGRGKRDAGVGLSNIDVNFYTTLVEKVVPDSFAPKGTAYILDTKTIKFLSFFDTPYLNSDASMQDEPGKVMNLDEMAGRESTKDPYAPLIDGFLSSEPTHDMDGVATVISFQIRGTFACLNPSVNVVVKFKASADDNNIAYAL